MQDLRLTFPLRNEGVYMIPSDLNIRINKIDFFNNKIIVI